MNELTIINKFGTLLGWNSLITNIMGRDVEGITQISYSDSEEITNEYGAGKFPIGQGEGNYAAEVSATFLKEELDAIQAALPPGRRLSDIAPFDITTQYTHKDGRIQKDRIRNVRFAGRGVEANQNDKMLTYQPPMICSHIDWNVI